MTGSTRSLGSHKIPGYNLHKPSGRARVFVNGDYVYIGEYGSEDSRRQYGEIIAKLASGMAIDPFASSDDSEITVAELVLAYLKHAETYYVKNGEVTDEFGCITSALKPVVALYGTIAASEFGPMKLKAVRQNMVDSKKKCRRYINMGIGRIRRCFRWAVENELIEPSVLQKLEAVSPLLAGRTEAIDHKARHPVPQPNIDAVKELVPERTRDVMELMLLTGARPGEMVKLTGEMIDRTGDVWSVKFADHKTVHRGKERVIDFGKKSQAILIKYLHADPSKKLFPIKRATLSNGIKKACTDLGIERFTGHWLRHNAGTRFRDEFGLDVAQVMLGHSAADVTQVYAQANRSKAREVARDAG